MKLLGLLISLLIFTSLHAGTPEEEGLKVAKIVEKASTGFIGEKSTTELVLIDAHGTKVVRLMEGMTKEIKGDGDMSISIFNSPKDVKGTKMLTHSHKKKDDDQWIFLPSLRRVKRISSSNKSSSFMGSEFSYEDLGSQEIEKYTHKLIKEAKMGKKKDPVWILERVPKTKSGYSKQKMYISKKLKAALKVDYFDRKGELLKVAYFKNYKKYKLKKKVIYRPGSIHIKNKQTRKESIFTWKKRKLGVVLQESKFKKSGLK